jgi:hypothetical protein
MGAPGCAGMAHEILVHQIEIDLPLNPDMPYNVTEQ